MMQTTSYSLSCANDPVTKRRDPTLRPFDARNGQLKYMYGGGELV